MNMDGKKQKINWIYTFYSNQLCQFFKMFFLVLHYIKDFI